jgi:hypothetical protein
MVVGLARTGIGRDLRKGGGSVPDAEEDLRATSESIQDDAVRLKELEQEKTALPLNDPRVAELSREIEALARSLADKATVERKLSDELQEG